ncbi:MAG: hypothetical protein C4304_08145 [candidate division GAL15 bacterium]
MALPLEGIRVVGLSQGAAGPVCTQLLGDFGAEVVKVEPPGGDWGRQLGPPFSPVRGGGSTAAAYVGMNRNKRSVVVDVKHPAGREVVLRLADGADVFVVSFRPGVAERLDLGSATLLARNPRLVYCSIPAFGQHGPWRDRPGVDGVVQAMSGLMSITGTEDRPPVKVGVPAADMVGGFLAATGILLALLARQRTGAGQVVDRALLDALLAFQTVPLAMFFCSNKPPARTGSAAPYAVPNEAFPSRDAYVMVAAYSPERWERLCRVLGRPELAADPRFSTKDARVRNRAALREVLEPCSAPAPPRSGWLPWRPRTFCARPCSPTRSWWTPSPLPGSGCSTGTPARCWSRKFPSGTMRRGWRVAAASRASRGAGAEVVLDYAQTVGATTGRLLPTGQVRGEVWVGARAGAVSTRERRGRGQRLRFLPRGGAGLARDRRARGG